MPRPAIRRRTVPSVPAESDATSVVKPLRSDTQGPSAARKKLAQGYSTDAKNLRDLMGFTKLDSGAISTRGNLKNLADRADTYATRAGRK